MLCAMETSTKVQADGSNRSEKTLTTLNRVSAKDLTEMVTVEKRLRNYKRKPWISYREEIVDTKVPRWECVKSVQ